MWTSGQMKQTAALLRNTVFSFSLQVGLFAASPLERALTNSVKATWGSKPRPEVTKNKSATLVEGFRSLRNIAVIG